jgi:hypothetical protein
MHAAANGVGSHVPIIEVLSKHAPAMLEAKTYLVRLNVFVSILPHAGGGEAGTMDTAPLRSKRDRLPLCCEVHH